MSLRSSGLLKRISLTLYPGYITHSKSGGNAMAALKQSYVNGASEVPLIGETIGQFFDTVGDKHADLPALIVRHQKVRLSYGELRNEVDKLAAGLLTLGLQPGDRIGIWSPNNSEWVLTQFATAKAGLILVNIN